ncbi:scavenger receptor cysteine-rich type 1 protein M130-like [Sphaeramia orbicularis]|uniref:scavenger receptor cysteine-rich type 1 protein M130-like n=1 Tax=Sphaeramia orbicularis TaxID=375764 RepID=UPI0011811A08|nr:scavenger receptor cysteine-rich type 1 protein M130-like [Sphaeramia orbicularis]
MSDGGSLWCRWSSLVHRPWSPKNIRAKEDEAKMRRCGRDRYNRQQRLVAGSNDLEDTGNKGSKATKRIQATTVPKQLGYPDDVRLVGGASRCNGDVQIKHHGEWRGVRYYYSSDLWTLKTADVICRRLDCGSAVSGRRSVSSGPQWSIIPTCLLSTSALMDCVRIEPYSGGSPLSLTCSDSVRLVHGSSLCSGRLEVLPCVKLTSGPRDCVELGDPDPRSPGVVMGFRVLVFSDFTVTCSVRPQYPGGSFRLISDTEKPLNLTLPAGLK